MNLKILVTDIDQDIVYFDLLKSIYFYTSQTQLLSSRGMIVNKTVTTGMKFLRFSTKVPISIVRRRIKFFTAHCARRKGELWRCVSTNRTYFPRGKRFNFNPNGRRKLYAPSLKRNDPTSQRGVLLRHYFSLSFPS